jgi:glutathione S-transferase
MAIGCLKAVPTAFYFRGDELLLILHDNTESGNAYKVRLLLSQLGTLFETIQYDVTKGETRTPDYLANINDNGRIPVL